MKSKLVLLTSKIGSGITPRGGSSVYVDKGTYLIRSQNIYNDHFEKDGLVCIVDETAEKMKGVTVCKNDVLINITGDSVARTFIVPNEFLPARVNQHVCILRTKPNLNPFYLYYFLIEPTTQNLLLNLSGSGGTRKALTKEMLEELEIELPSIQSQQKIIFPLVIIKLQIENLQKQNKILEKITQSIFKSWFIDFDGQTEFVDSELGQIPKGWKISSLSLDMSIIHGYAFKGEFFSDTKTNNILLTPGNFAIGGGFKGDKMKYYEGPIPEKYILSEGDLLVSMTDLSKMADTLGFPALIPKHDSRLFLHNQRLGKIKINSESYLTKEFLYILFCGSDYRNEILASASGTTVKHTSPERILSHKFVLPDEDTLKKFQILVEPIFNNIDSNSSTISILSKIRDSLLPKLMSGEIRVPICVT